MFYVWIHALIIAGKALKKTTQYETAVCVLAVVFFGFFVVGSIM